MQVRIDETRDDEAPVPVDPRRMRAGDKVRPDLRDPPGSNDDHGMWQRRLALRRDERHVLDDEAVRHDL